jgi:hypothetical protein
MPSVNLFENTNKVTFIIHIPIHDIVEPENNNNDNDDVLSLALVEHLSFVKLRMLSEVKIMISAENSSS